MAEFQNHEACPACESKDNLARYSDGGAYCFGCGYHEKGGETHARREQPIAAARASLLDGEVKALPKRGLHEAACQKYGYRVGTYKGKPCQIADYYNADGRRCAQKIRFSDKTFTWVGDPKRAGLFGEQTARSGGRKIVVTEGEIDCLSMSQVQGNKWPVVSLKDGAQSWKKSLAPAMEWLETYEEIILMFDADEPGQAAAREASELFTPGKVKIARIPAPFKDPNDMLVAGKVKELVGAMWDAKTFRPEGIVAGFDLIDDVLAPPPPSIPIPWSELDGMMRGQRKGEITTWCGGTGTGKSQLVRELVAHLRRTGAKVGVIALEESTRGAALAQVSIEMEQRLHDPEVRATVTDEQIKAAAEKALDGIFFFEHFGSVDPDVLLPKIRYMVKGLDVEWVVIDHLSIMVSGNATEGDERKRIDELMTKLRTMVENLNVGMHLVSHLRKAQGTPHEEGGRITLDDLRGSGAIKQVSDNIVAAERNQQAEEAAERNLTQLRLLKCRMFGETGPAGHVSYDSNTGLIGEVAADVFAERDARHGTPTSNAGDSPNNGARDF